MNADGRDPYSAYPNAFGDLYGPEAQTLVYKDIAEILNLQRFLNETPPFALEEHPDWPVYPAVETLHYAWDEDAYDRSKETLYDSFERGTLRRAPADRVLRRRHDVRLRRERERRRPARRAGDGRPRKRRRRHRRVRRPARGPVRDRRAQRVRAVHRGGRGIARLPLARAESQAIPTGAGRRRPGGCRGRVVSLGADETAVVRRRREWDAEGRRGHADGSAFAKISTATGPFPPWANDNARTRPRGPQDPEALGEFRERARRCGRLSLENLVLRGGWSETGGAAALVAGGELRVKDCVVEGHRTGVAAGRGGAGQPGRPAGHLQECVSKTPPAAGGTARTPSRRIGSPRTRAITCTTSTRDRCRWTGARGSTAGRRVDAATEETGA